MDMGQLLANAWWLNSINANNLEASYSLSTLHSTIWLPGILNTVQSKRNMVIITTMQLMTLSEATSVDAPSVWFTEDGKKKEYAVVNQ